MRRRAPSVAPKRIGRHMSSADLSRRRSRSRHGVARHRLQADAVPVFILRSELAEAVLVPVDDREGLLQAEEVIEARRPSSAGRNLAGSAGAPGRRHRPRGTRSMAWCRWRVSPQERIDRHLRTRHGYAPASVGTTGWWPGLGRLAASGSCAGRTTSPDTVADPSIMARSRRPALARPRHVAGLEQARADRPRHRR